MMIGDKSLNLTRRPRPFQNRTDSLGFACDTRMAATAHSGGVGLDGYPERTLWPGDATVRQELREAVRRLQGRGLKRAAVWCVEGAAANPPAPACVL